MGKIDEHAICEELCHMRTGHKFKGWKADHHCLWIRRQVSAQVTTIHALSFYYVYPLPSTYSSNVMSFNLETMEWENNHEPFPFVTLHAGTTLPHGNSFISIGGYNDIRQIYKVYDYNEISWWQNKMTIFAVWPGKSHIQSIANQGAVWKRNTTGSSSVGRDQDTLHSLE